MQPQKEVAFFYISASFLISRGVFPVCSFKTFLKYDDELNPSIPLISSMGRSVVSNKSMLFLHSTF